MKEHTFDKLPQHIAFIIDGNGRWAKRRGMPRSFGHKAGMKTLKKTILNCFDLGIDVVSIFAFSTENWNRPQKELDCLFELFEKFFKEDTFDYKGYGIKLNIMGDYTKFPQNLVENAKQVLQETKNNKRFILNVGVNYGGRNELLKVMNELGNENVKNITEKDVEKHLYTAGIVPPDLVVRTSGEQRISNFMLWQMAYSELYFTKTMWPDFNKKALYLALDDYQKRNRRYGEIKE